MIDPFKTYMLVFNTQTSTFIKWNDDLLELMKEVHKHVYWYIMDCEVIEGLNYPRKLIARSSECYIGLLLSRN